MLQREYFKHETVCYTQTESAKKRVCLHEDTLYSPCSWTQKYRS